MISLRHITKRFGALTAVDDASLDLDNGEILAVVGENGAGKSTLMNVLAGIYHPDSGEIRVDQRPVRFATPRDAIAQGIGMVHQHFTLVPPLTVAENVVLGKEPQRHGLLDVGEAERQVEASCRRFGFQLDPKARAAHLSIGSQQKLEILKALHRGAQTLILDEPTAVLTPQETDDLFRMMRELALAHHALVFIAHKLKEVLSVADRIAVMRKGKIVAQVEARNATQELLAGLMIGSNQMPAGPAADWPKAVPSSSQREGPLLESADLKVLGDDGRVALNGISIKVLGGEIVGIAGVDGNGQRELADAVTGLRPISGGSAQVLSIPLSRATVTMLRERGLGHVPEDRLARAIVAPMTLEENVSLGRQSRPPFAKGIRIDFNGRRQRAEEILHRHDVRPADPKTPIGHLSGGNQQKVVVGRELDCQPKLLVVVQPTRGLDIAAVSAVRTHLIEARRQGAGILLISLDLEELLALSDRLYVMQRGRVVGEVARAEFDEKAIGRMMLSELPSPSGKGLG